MPLHRPKEVDAYAVTRFARILISEREDEGVDISAIARATIAEGETSLRLAKVDHVQRQREVGMVVDRVTTQQLRRCHRRS
jgi:non-ribosomal peptide synthetase component E (peptide arylation enzyme)